MRSFNFPVALNISCDLTGGSVVLQHNLQMSFPKVSEGRTPGSLKIEIICYKNYIMEFTHTQDGVCSVCVEEKRY
jgi:hypothetical protein